MKKLLCIVLITLLALSMTACGSGKNEIEKEATSVTSDSSRKETVRTPVESEPSPEPESEPEEENTYSDAVTIDETVLFDELGIKITAKKVELGGLFGTELKLLIENNYGEAITVQAEDVSVNGYMVGALLSSDVADGKKSNDELTILSSDLELCGIETIADLEFSFHIITSDGWETIIDTDRIQVRTSAYDTYTYSYDDSGEVLYNANGVKIIAKGWSKGDWFDTGVIIYVENNSENTILVTTRDESVNGFMITGYLYSEVSPGKRAIDVINFLQSDLEDNEVGDVETVELYFSISDADSWGTIAESDIVTIKF